MIYFDNAATSFPKPKSVVDELYRCVCEYCGNPGRSSHILSRTSAEAIYDAREEVSELFSAGEPEKVVFTYNATYALNLVLKTTLAKKTHVLISDIEHNSVIRPIEKLKDTAGVEYSVFSSNDVEKSIKSNIRRDTTAIVSTLASNVTGAVIDINVLSDMAKKYGLELILDASQAAGHFPIDLSEKYYTALCAPGHKGLYGIQGSGFVIFSDNKARDTFIEGGSGSDSANKYMPTLLPERYEGGTLATPAIATLASGIRFIKSVGVEKIENRLKILSETLSEGLKNIPSCVLYPHDNGIVSFNLSNFPSTLVSSELDKYGICTRGGLHCAPSAHSKLGTLKQGTVRVSLSYFNTEDEIDTFCNILKYKIAKI